MSFRILRRFWVLVFICALCPVDDAMADAKNRRKLQTTTKNRKIQRVNSKINFSYDEGDIPDEFLDIYSREPLISKDYRGGAHLIYDCYKRHFVCVDDTSFAKCRNNREEALTKKDIVLPCAPLKKFKYNQECINVLYEKMHNISSKAFCVNGKKITIKK